ncbi:MAG: hypothetical protein WB902_25400 [Acetobacteraceae bacterium]
MPINATLVGWKFGEQFRACAVQVIEVTCRTGTPAVATTLPVASRMSSVEEYHVPFSTTPLLD